MSNNLELHWDQCFLKYVDLVYEKASQLNPEYAHVFQCLGAESASTVTYILGYKTIPDTMDFQIIDKKIEEITSQQFERLHNLIYWTLISILSIFQAESHEIFITETKKLIGLTRDEANIVTEIIQLGDSNTALISMLIYPHICRIFGQEDHGMAIMRAHPLAILIGINLRSFKDGRIEWEMGTPWNFNAIEKSREKARILWANSEDGINSAIEMLDLLHEPKDFGIGRNYAIGFMQKIGQMMLKAIEPTAQVKRFEVAAKGRKIAEISSYLFRDRFASSSAEDVILILESMQKKLSFAKKHFEHNEIKFDSIFDVTNNLDSDHIIPQISKSWLELIYRHDVFENIVNVTIRILKQVSNDNLTPDEAIHAMRSIFGEEAYAYGTTLINIGRHLTDQISSSTIYLGIDNTIFTNSHPVPFGWMSINQKYHELTHHTAISDLISIERSIWFKDANLLNEGENQLSIPDYNGINGVYRIFCDLIYRFSTISQYGLVSRIVGDVYASRDHPGFVCKSDGSLNDGTLSSIGRERFSKGLINHEELETSSLSALALANLIKDEILSDFEQIHHCKYSKC